MDKRFDKSRHAPVPCVCVRARVFAIHTTSSISIAACSVQLCLPTVSIAAIMYRLAFLAVIGLVEAQYTVRTLIPKHHIPVRIFYQSFLYQSLSDVVESGVLCFSVPPISTLLLVV